MQSYPIEVVQKGGVRSMYYLNLVGMFLGAVLVVIVLSIFLGFILKVVFGIALLALAYYLVMRAQAFRRQKNRRWR